MTKKHLDDFAATLTAQLKDAAEQMRNMRTPPGHPTKEASSKESHEHTPTPPKVPATKRPKKGIPNKETHELNADNHPSTIPSKKTPVAKSKSTAHTANTPYEPTLEPAIKQRIVTDNTLSIAVDTQSVTASDYLNTDEESPLLLTPILFPDEAEALEQQPSSLSNDAYKNTDDDTIQVLSVTDNTPTVTNPINDTYIHNDPGVDSALPSSNEPLYHGPVSHSSYQRHYPEPLSKPTQQQQQGAASQQSQSIQNNNEQIMTAYDNKQLSQSPPWGQYSPADLHTVRINTATVGGARQLLLDALVQLRKESPQVTINLKRLATVLGLSYGTVRNTISRLVREGVIFTTQIRTGDVHGVYIEFAEDSPSLSSATVNYPSMTIQKKSLPTMQTQSPPDVEHNPIWHMDKDTISMLWPYAVAAGLSPSAIEHLKIVFTIQRFDDTHLAQCLRYLNWEIEHIALHDASKAAQLFNQWMQSMRQRGVYPLPLGYPGSET